MPIQAVFVGMNIFQVFVLIRSITKNGRPTTFISAGFSKCAARCNEKSVWRCSSDWRSDVINAADRYFWLIIDGANRLSNDARVLFELGITNL